MNKKKKTAILSVIASLSIMGTMVFCYTAFADKSKYSMDKSKYENELLHDKIEKENIEKNKSKKNDLPDEKALSDDPSNYDEFGIFYDKDVQLPLPSEVAKKYVIETFGLAPYNGIYTGSLAENPNDGIIINRFERVKTRERNTYFYIIPETGKITLESISSDQKIFTFKTESGKTGTFDITDGKGKYSFK